MSSSDSRQRVSTRSPLRSRRFGRPSAAVNADVEMPSSTAAGHVAAAAAATTTSTAPRARASATASRSSAAHDARMRALLKHRKLHPGLDPNSPHGMGEAEFHALEHAVDAKLGDAPLATFLEKTRRIFTVRSGKPLVSRGWADFDRLIEAQLAARGGLAMVPHELVAASGDKYALYLVPLESLVRYMLEDPSLAEAFDFEPTYSDAADGSHVYGGVQTGRWYAQTCTSPCLVRGALVFALNLFSDGTVRESTGAKYHALMLKMSNLPIELRHLDENILMWGLAPLVSKKVAYTDARLVDMIESERKAWLREERESLSSGSYEVMLKSIETMRAGKVMQYPVGCRSCRRRLVVPAIGCLEADTPEHLGLAKACHCGFCDLGKRARKGLANPELSFTQLSSEYVEKLSKPYADELTRQRDNPPLGGQKRSAKGRLDALAAPITAAGLHLPPNQSRLLGRSWIDGFKNVGISPMHVRAKADLLEPTCRLCNRKAEILRHPHPRAGICNRKAEILRHPHPRAGMDL